MSELKYADVINLEVVDLTQCSTQERAEWAVRHVEELAEFLEKAAGKISPADQVHVARHTLQAASLARRAASLQAAADAAQTATVGGVANAQGVCAALQHATILGKCVETLLTLLRSRGDTIVPQEMVTVIRLSLEAALMGLTASVMRESARSARVDATRKMAATAGESAAVEAAEGGEK